MHKALRLALGVALLPVTSGRGGYVAVAAVFLPDGTEFVAWECRTEWTKTWVVDQMSPEASDENPGTAERPFRTIGRAAGGGGIWLDWDDKNSRVTRNLVVATQPCCNASIFVEASRETNWVDHNVLWDVRGVAISAGDTDNLVVAYNLIGPSARIGVRASVLTIGP